MNKGLEQGDAQEVANTASLLEVSEFEVFRLAYYRWFGRSAEPQEIDALFSRYLGKAAVPLWVRAFTRQIRQLQLDKRLDRRAFGLEPAPAPDYSSILHGALALIVMLIIVALLVYLSDPTDPSLALVCQLPPCY